MTVKTVEQMAAESVALTRHAATLPDTVRPTDTTVHSSVSAILTAAMAIVGYYFPAR